MTKQQAIDAMHSGARITGEPGPGIITWIILGAVAIVDWDSGDASQYPYADLELHPTLPPRQSNPASDAYAG